MIKLIRLYSQPEMFSPIKFEAGINFIVGEKSDASNKTNGVGKSVCIEFINFCLLKKYNDSRLSLIPKQLIDESAVVYLELSFYGEQMTISRSIKFPNRIAISRRGIEVEFETVEDASDYLGNMYFAQYPAHTERVSFRTLLAPLIRDEGSEFKDIIKTYNTDSSIPRDYRPHLFYLGFGVELYTKIGKTISELQQKSKYVTETTRLLTNDKQIKISDAKAQLNELESEVSKINTSIEQLRNFESFNLIQDEIVSLDSKLKELRERQHAIKFKIKQIDVLPKPEVIDHFEISLLFNQFKSGLGDMVKKSLDDVQKFHDRIDNFRNTIVNSSLAKLKSELHELNEQIRKVDDLYGSKISLIDNGTILGNLKSAISIFNDKNVELSRLRTLIDQYNQAEKDKKYLQSRKNIEISEFDERISELWQILRSFEQTILDIHEAIIGNRQAHFEIRTKGGSSQAKEFVVFDLRTDDDRSWSTERLKVFIYDTALLFNEFTRFYHPGFLVHDNIFNVDNDSLAKSLNFLFKQDTSSSQTFQYILTINRDMVEALEERDELIFNMDDYIRARFSKSKRFLHIAKYHEISNRK